MFLSLSEINQASSKQGFMIQPFDWSQVTKGNALGRKGTTIIFSDVSAKDTWTVTICLTTNEKNHVELLPLVIVRKRVYISADFAKCDQ